jgi:glycosyltransferase involved in cell wall biosynthesis
VPASELALALAFADGSATSIDVTKALETHSERRRKLRELLWVGRAVLRRARQRDFRGIVHRAKSQNYGAPSLDSLHVVEGLLPRLAGDRAITVVFDHNMGGGANAYRRAVIDERLAAGRTVLLCTYSLPTLDYRLHLLRAGAGEKVFRLSSFLALESIVAGSSVDELFLNSPVSFDEPLPFAEWLAALREAHPRRRLTVALNDYFAVCPSFVLLDADGRYCGIPSLSQCEACLARHGASYVALSPRTEISSWRASWRRCLQAADEVRCFSRSSRDLLLRAFPYLDARRVTLVPHRIDFAPSRLPRVDPAAPLVIGVVGQISEQKGARIVKELVARADRESLDLRVVVIGSLDIPVDSSRLRVTGPYQRDDLVGLIERHGVNMALFPSIWPETFSYVVEEIRRLGLPIVAFDLGAPAERLRGDARARLCAETSADAALDAIVAFHRELVQRTADSPAARPMLATGDR